MSAPSVIQRDEYVRLEDAAGADVTLRGIERGEIGAVEAIDALLTEELTTGQNRRARMAVQMARLWRQKPPPVPPTSPSSHRYNRNRASSSCSPDCSSSSAPKRVHLIEGRPEPETDLSLALGVEAVKAGRSVYFRTLAEMITSLAKAERDGAFATGSATTAASRCSSWTRSATSPSRPAAAISSSSSSTPATRRAP